MVWGHFTAVLRVIHTSMFKKPYFWYEVVGVGSSVTYQPVSLSQVWRPMGARITQAITGDVSFTDIQPSSTMDHDI